MDFSRRIWTAVLVIAAVAGAAGVVHSLSNPAYEEEPTSQIGTNEWVSTEPLSFVPGSGLVDVVVGQWLVDRAGDLYVYASSTGNHSADLWLYDQTREERKLAAAGARIGTLDPRGNRLAVVAEGSRIVIAELDGTVLYEAQNSGGSPMFSPSGDRLAYVRLAEPSSAHRGSPELFQGVVTIDLESQTEEELLAPVSGWHGAVYGVSGWSPDQSVLFLAAHVRLTRQIGTWPMAFEGNGPAQFVEDAPDVGGDLPPLRPLAKRSIWIPGERSVVFSFNDEIWLYKFTPNSYSRLKERRLLARGQFLQSTSEANLLIFLQDEEWHTLDLSVL